MQRTLAALCALTATAALAVDTAQTTDNLRDRTRDQTQTVLEPTKPGRDQATSTTCGHDVLGGIGFDWCMQNGPATDHTKVLWYFHGYQSNPRALAESPNYALMQQYWKNVAGVGVPVYIGVTFGDGWFLNDMPSQWVAGHPRLRDFFVSRVMPHMEAKAGASDPAKRFAVGESMGGYNTSQLIEHTTLFDKASLGCAALFTITPWSTPAEKDAYVTRNTGAIAATVNQGLWVVGRDYPTLADWNRNDPLQNTPNAPIYVWWDALDEYGFGEGDQKMAQLNAVTAQMNAGRHCDSNVSNTLAIAEFLQ